MRPFRRSFIVCMLLCFAMGFCNIGCGLSPIQKVNVAEEAFTKANNTVAENIRLQITTDMGEIKTTQALIHEIDALLDDAKAKAIAGDPIGFNLVWPRVRGALDRLLIRVAQEEQRRDRSRLPSTRETSWNLRQSSQRLALSQHWARHSWRRSIGSSVGRS